MEERQSEWLAKAETLSADRGYDDTKLIEKCWDRYGIKPVIDIRNSWKDGESTRQLKENATYNYKEAVSKGRQTDLLGTASVSFSDHLVIYSFFEAGISPYF